MTKLKKGMQEYGRTPNSLLNSKEVSLKAKGLFAFIESKPDNWEFSVRSLEQLLKEGREAISDGLKELESSGYLTRTKKHDTDGRWIVCYITHDCPKKPYTEKPLTEKPFNGKPVNNKRKSNKESLYKESISISKEIGVALKYGKPEVNGLFDYWQEKIGYPISSQVQKNRNACNNLLKKYGSDAAKQLIDGVALANESDFAPRIADFIELQAKTNKLILWGKSQQKKGIAVIS
jgi:hypothetical protein